MAQQTSFALQFRNAMGVAKARLHFITREVLISLGSNVVLRSPVDTGHFRLNWQLGVGAAPGAELEGTDPSGQVAIGRITEAVPTAAWGGIYYLRNNVKYGPDLERGHSQQAPHGMVGLASVEFQGLVDRKVAEARSEIK